MNDEIEEITVSRTEWIPKDEFRQFCKTHDAKLKVVEGFYRWVVDDAGDIYMVRPKEDEA